MADIFLSYSRADRAAIEPLAEQIAAAGYSVWWDSHLTGGGRFLKETEAELNAAKVVLVAWSKTSIESHWVADEAAAGRDTGRLLPISLDRSMPPLGFRQFHAVDCSKWKRDDGAALKQLTGALGKLTAPSGEASAAQRKKVAAPFGLPLNPLLLGLAALAAVAILAMVAMILITPAQSAVDNRLTAFFGFTAGSDDPAVAAMAENANAETYQSFAALGLETVSEASVSNFPLAQQLETAAKLNARFAVGGELRRSASGFDLSLRIDDPQSRKTLWRETISGGAKDTVTLPVAAAEQASGTIRCLIRMFKDTSRPSEKLMTALSRACASQRVEAPSRITAWRAAANLAPDSSAILAMLGSSLASNNLSTTGGERDELIRDSAEVLKRALQLEPGLTDAQANLAMLESQSNPTEWNKRLAGILAAPRSGVELVESAVPDMLRGAGLVTVGQFADAIPHLQHAVQADPLFPAPQLWLSMSLMENGQIREGRAMYEQELSRRASPTYWNAWAMQEFSDPVGLEHALKLVPAGISADTTDCLRGLAVALADKHPEARARSAEPVLACMRRIPGGFFLIPAASALGYLDEAFAAAVDAVDAGDALFLLHLKVTRPMRADQRFLPLMKKSGAYQYWHDTRTLPDWCKLPEEQGFETCVALQREQGM